MLRVFYTNVFLLIWSASVSAETLLSETPPVCQGSVLERRLGLVELGELAEKYIDQHGNLPDLCAKEVKTITDAIPARIASTSVCGSSEQGIVYYTCELSTTVTDDKGSFTQVLETCRYYFKDQSLACDNRSTVTTVEEGGAAFN